MLKRDIGKMIPEIFHKLDNLLLSRPVPELRDSEKMLYGIYKLAQSKYHKLNTNKQIKFLKLQGEFLEIYGRIKAKQEEQGTKIKYRTQVPGYYIAMPRRRKQSILNRLRQIAYPYRKL